MTTSTWIQAIADGLDVPCDAAVIDGVWHAVVSTRTENRTVTVECVEDDVTLTALSGPLTIKLALGKKRVRPGAIVHAVLAWVGFDDARRLNGLRHDLTQEEP